MVFVKDDNTPRARIPRRRSAELTSALGAKAWGGSYQTNPTDFVVRHLDGWNAGHPGDPRQERIAWYQQWGHTSDPGSQAASGPDGPRGSAGNPPCLRLQSLAD